jgi:hypothetical protein
MPDAEAVTRAGQKRRTAAATLSFEPDSQEPGNEGEDSMESHDLIDTASPRYGFDPKLPFSATLAGAERRREAAVAGARARPGARSPGRLIRRLSTLIGISPR